MLNRTTIGVFGPTNAGKSTLVNMLIGQDVSITSPMAGTTTDPVKKSIEINGIGPCVFIDTPGFDDETALGTQRVTRAKEILRGTDIAIIVLSSNEEISPRTKQWIELVKNHAARTIVVTNDFGNHKAHDGSILVNALTGKNREGLLFALGHIKERIAEKKTIVTHLTKAGDKVLLVMPQDKQAPQGRLILPQVQTIRELLDHGCTAVCCTPENYVGNLSIKPDLIITDSQVFDFVYKNKPDGVRLTSFSVLMAQWKGDIETFIEGVKAFSKLDGKSKILIAEACTHAPLSEDIGREKIPALIRKVIDPNIHFDIVSGNDWTKDIEQYDLVIHCGACMINRRDMISRIESAKKAGVPITNYGITMAYFTKILDKIVY
ncbi:MAG: [FeFe] hydrogenase H-cluster maturation GTPase HydF [Paludibacteraceae bacterium]|nr:[FeFe] hydrogenase H-cluster maturation GTPase HydF [Paludibacteraceae bacterium]